MQDAKEEVRARLNIEDVVGEYVQLKRAGRNFKGLSPFTNERTPSFTVSPEKHIWHDFSSGKGGDQNAGPAGPGKPADNSGKAESHP